MKVEVNRNFNQKGTDLIQWLLMRSLNKVKSYRKLMYVVHSVLMIALIADVAGVPFSPAAVDGPLSSAYDGPLSSASD